MHYSKTFLPDPSFQTIQCNILQKAFVGWFSLKTSPDSKAFDCELSLVCCFQTGRVDGDVLKLETELGKLSRFVFLNGPGGGVNTFIPSINNYY